MLRPATDSPTPEHEPEAPRRSYLMAGLVRCGVCRRRMDAHWVHGRAGYRCRHGHTSSRPRPPAGPKNLYVREDVLISQLVDRVPPASAGQNVVGSADGDVYTRGAAVVAHLKASALVGR